MVKLYFRTIWLSDIHLGVKDCKAEFLLDFLHATDCETLYLVGDIIDFWQMPRGQWPDKHNQVLQLLLARSMQKGRRVIYIPGNHDAIARHYIGLFFGGVEIAPSQIHETADGRRLWITHGDEFDHIVQCGSLLEWLGDNSYSMLLHLNRLTNYARRYFNYPYWSLASFLKLRIRTIAQYIARFEQAAIFEAKRQGVDGIVCGHIHKPALQDIEGMVYCNDGDWVESCTALVEHPDGQLEVLHWADRNVVVLSERRRETDRFELPRIA